MHKITKSVWGMFVSQYITSTELIMLVTRFREMVSGHYPKETIANFILKNADANVNEALPGRSGLFAGSWLSFLDAVMKSSYRWVLSEPEIVRYYPREFAYRVAKFNHVLTHEMILDDTQISDDVRTAFWMGYWYSRGQYPHHAFELFGSPLGNPLLPKRPRTPWSRTPYELPKTLAEAVESDSVSIFEMERLMCGKKISLSLVHILISKNAGNILSYWLTQKGDALSRLVSLKDLFFYLCGYGKKDLLFKVLPTIHQCNPQLIPEARDDRGNNALWYAFHNREKGMSEVCDELKRLGCDPNVRNAINLNYTMVSKYECQPDHIVYRGDEE